MPIKKKTKTGRYDYFPVYRRFLSRISTLKAEAKLKDWKVLFDKLKSLIGPEKRSQREDILQLYLDAFEPGCKLSSSDSPAPPPVPPRRRILTKVSALAPKKRPAASPANSGAAPSDKSGNSSAAPDNKYSDSGAEPPDESGKSGADPCDKSGNSGAAAQTPKVQAPGAQKEDHVYSKFKDGKNEIQLISMRPRIFVIHRPSRGQMKIPVTFAQNLSRAIKFQVPTIYVGMSEKTDLRPLILIYGEHKSTEILRAQHRLSEKDVFILGNSFTNDVDKSSVFYPFASQLFMALTKLYSPLHILGTPWSPFSSLHPWASRPKLVAFLSCREENRERCTRFNFVGELSARLRAQRMDPVHSLGCVCPPKSEDLHAAFLAFESSLPNSYTYFDKAIDAYKEYKFVIAFENSSKFEGYITEKAMDAALSGAVPIYWGHKTSIGIFNPQRVINLSEFDEMDQKVSKCIERMKQFLKTPPDFREHVVEDDKFEFYSAPQHATLKSRLNTWLQKLSNE